MRIGPASPSPRIDCIAEGEQTALTLMGYDISADTGLADHFII